jgi:hypothetical protein
MDNTSKPSKIYSVTITKAWVNGKWYTRLYINQELIKDFSSIKEAVSVLHDLVSVEDIIDDKRND